MCYKMRTLTKLGEAMTDRETGGDLALEEGCEPAASLVALPDPARDGGAPASDDEYEPSKDNLALAARLGITAERVLKELAAIGFSDMSRIVNWAPGDEGLQIKLAKDIDRADRAAIAEIVASASTGRIYRIKLHDKRGALALLTHCVEMAGTVDDNGADIFDSIVRELDRRASKVRTAENSSRPE